MFRRIGEWRLFALAPAAWAEAVDARLRAERLRAGALVIGDVAAIIGPSAGLRLSIDRLGGGRLPSLRRAGPPHRRILEVVVGSTPCIAVSELAPPMAKRDLLRLLKQYSSSLAHALQEYGSFIQYDVVAHWDLGEVIEELERDGRTPRRLKLPEGPLAKAYAADAEARLQALIAARKSAIGERFLDRLKTAAHEFAPLTLGGAGVVAGATAILRRSQAGKLDEALEAARREALIEISCVGPMPAASMIAIEIVDTRAKQITAARKILSTPPQATRGDIRGAYYDAMKINHPDFRKNGRINTAAIAAIHNAYEVLLTYADLQGARNPEDAVDFATLAGDAPYALRLRKFTASKFSNRPIAA